MKFLGSFLRRHFAGKPVPVLSRNISCFFFRLGIETLRTRLFSLCVGLYLHHRLTITEFNRLYHVEVFVSKKWLLDFFSSATLVVGYITGKNQGVEYRVQELRHLRGNRHYQHEIRGGIIHDVIRALHGYYNVGSTAQDHA